MTTLTATEAYKNFSDVLHHAHYTGEVVIEKNGKPFAAISRVRTPPSKPELLDILKRVKARRDPADSARFADDLESIHATFNIPPVVKW